MRRTVSALLTIGALALAACSGQGPRAHAFDTKAPAREDGPVKLDGGPETASGHARNADAIVNGFDLLDAPPAASPAPAQPDGFQLLAAAPSAQDAEPASAAAVTLPAEAAPAPAAAVAPPEPVRPRHVRHHRAAHHPAKAAPQARALVALYAPRAAPPKAEPVALPAPQPPSDPSRAVMFTLCLVAAGALWRWHKQCLKAAAPPPSPAFGGRRSARPPGGGLSTPRWGEI